MRPALVPSVKKDCGGRSVSTEKALKDASDEINNLFQQKTSQFNDQTAEVQQSAEDMTFNHPPATHYVWAELKAGKTGQLSEYI